LLIHGDYEDEVPDDGSAVDEAVPGKGGEAAVRGAERLVNDEY
jgi:hypothetical protein